MARCSCKLFESHGVPYHHIIQVLRAEKLIELLDHVPCRHIIQVLRAEKLIELPDHYIMTRWQKWCKRFVFYMLLCNCDMFYSSDVLIPFFLQSYIF
jgi:hypothetical protein